VCPRLQGLQQIRGEQHDVVKRGSPAQEGVHAVLILLRALRRVQLFLGFECVAVQREAIAIDRLVRPSATLMDKAGK